MYRKRAKYTKSIGQCKRERARRKILVDLLLHSNFNFNEIAVKLGVSRKTVYRDMQKLKGYLTFLQSKRAEKIQKIVSEKFDQYPIMTRFSFIGESMAAQDNPKKARRLFWKMLSGKYRPSRDD